MHDSSNFESGKIGAGLDNGGEGEVGGGEQRKTHVAVEEDGMEGEAGLRGGSDEGIEEEGIGVGDGEEEEVRVGDRTSDAGQREELGEKGPAAVETRDNHASMDLLERADARASF